jgi:pimeloyl-ACP methyl ester carboxylesterase
MKKSIIIRLVFLVLFLLSYYSLQVLTLQWDFLVSQFFILLVTVWIIVWFLIVYFYLWKKFLNKNKKSLYLMYYPFVFISIFSFILPGMFLISQLWKIKVGTQSNFDIYEKHIFVNYTSEDNYKISGIFLPYNDASKTIIFSHWLWANKKNFYEYARSYYHLWYNVLIFDFRWHWESNWQTSSFWYNEAQDIFAWYKFLKANYPEKTQSIYGVWYSMWAAATLFAQEKYHIFDAIILDSPYASINDMIQTVYWYFPHFYQTYLSHFSNYFSTSIIWVPLLEIQPIKTIGSLYIPLLLFHCTQDNLIPYQQSQKILQKYPQAQHQFFENCWHVQWLTSYEDIYMTKVKTFLSNK